MQALPAPSHQRLARGPVLAGLQHLGERASGDSLAYHDALTGLPNRPLLQDRMGVAMAQARRRSRRLGVLFLDLDHFEDVNESLGPKAGDELLRAIAERLEAAMRSEDTVARIGGDEFVVLLTNLADATQAAVVGQRILVLLRAPVRVGERELFVNGSLGISIYPEDATDSSNLLRKAGAALCRAKAEGRDNCQLYTLAECEAFLIQHQKAPVEWVPPIGVLPDPEAGAGRRAPAAGDRPSIVVVEDSDDAREAIEIILAGAGYRVIATGDPRRALELVRQHQPHLVLCDIAMPEMDGHDVVRALQADAATARVPVVFLTARHGLEERVRAFRLGVVDYLTKPIAPDVLKEKIAGILNAIDHRKDAGEARGGDSARELVVETHPRQERILTSDPDALLGGGVPPTFDDIPPGLREVLIADNNPLFRGFLRSVLEARGFLVHDAGGGEEALRMALVRPPQIALLDVRMEGLDGFEIDRRLRAHRATRNIPVLFLSGGQAYDEGQRVVEAGVESSVSVGSSVRDILGRMKLLMKRYAQAGAAGGDGMQGAIEVLGAPGVLQMCHQGGLTGALEATHQARTIRMTFDRGRLATAASDETQGREAVIQFLAWTEGCFAFEPGATSEGGAITEPTDFLILEACRILDENSANEGRGRIA